MTIRASAPGKLMLVGEYAVLEQAPALVVAVERRAEVNVSPLAGTTSSVQTSIDPQQHRFCWRQARIEWQQGGGLSLFQASLEVLSAQTSVPSSVYRWQLDSQAFFSADGSKLGFGSSAALSTALVAAGLSAAGQDVTPQRCFEGALAAHRRFQGTRGSGADIAASCYGGLICYQRERDGEPARIEPLQWPEDLHMACIWSGSPAKTTDFLSALEHWADAQPRDYRRQMDALAAAAEACAAALHQGDSAAFIQESTAFADQLRRLEQASGLAITPASHGRLAALAQSYGVLLKTSGAGGGDLSLAFSQDREKLQGLTRQVANAGYLVLATPLDYRGVSVAP